jgi:hypothetical protein
MNNLFRKTEIRAIGLFSAERTRRIVRHGDEDEAKGSNHRADRALGPGMGAAGFLFESAVTH